MSCGLVSPLQLIVSDLMGQTAATQVHLSQLVLRRKSQSCEPSPRITTYIVQSDAASGQIVTQDKYTSIL